MQSYEGEGRRNGKAKKWKEMENYRERGIESADKCLIRHLLGGPEQAVSALPAVLCRNPTSGCKRQGGRVPTQTAQRNVFLKFLKKY